MYSEIVDSFQQVAGGVIGPIIYGLVAFVPAYGLLTLDMKKFMGKNDQEELKVLDLSTAKRAPTSKRMSVAEEKKKRAFAMEAINLSRKKMQAGEGGPFGAVIVRKESDEIVARGWNKVTSTNDPTAHAEVTAIRNACSKLGTFNLAGCELYTSCEPCPMCLAAMYWSRVDKVYYCATRNDAADAGFDDSFIYDQVPLHPCERSLDMEQMAQKDAKQVFELWKVKADKIEY